MAKTKTTTGVWLDKDSGKIVTKAPHRGRLLVAPGHEVTDELQADIDRQKADFDTFADTQAAVEAPAQAAVSTTPKAPAKRAAAKS